MKSQRNIARYLFGLILAVSVLMTGFVPSGYSRSRYLVSSLTVSHLPAVQDGGESWKPVDTGLSSLSISALAIDPVNTSTIYAGTRGGGMFKSIDGGATWRQVGLNSGHVAALAINFANPNIVHAGVADGGWCNSTFPLFKSADGGASWSNAHSPAQCDISLLVLDPTSPNTLYAGSLGSYLGAGSIILWKSIDGGATWSNRWFGNPGLASYGLVIDPANPQTLYAPGDIYGAMQIIDSGLFKSTDGGASWAATGLTHITVEAVAIDPLNPNTLYAGSANWGTPQESFRRMFKSADGGASWITINNGLPNISRVTTIVVDRDNPSILYIGTSDGVFKSTDGGANWSDFNNGLTNLDVRVLTLAPGNPNTLYAGTAGGVFKITENTPATNPIDEAQFLVRQHYRDFLGREPDQAGLDFWTNEITSCGTEEGCLEVKRINVSAAFFLSIEFQQTGFLAHRFARASFGRMPRLAEFLPDTRLLGRGVVVGAAGWEQKLEANKQAFAGEWVSRTAFKAIYDGKTDAEYVDALILNTGAAFGQAERDALVSGLSGGAETRGTVLRKVAEDRAFYDREFDSAFALMQYFGYLRRNPDDPPDGSMAGYNFWLQKLVNHGGDFVEAEMVKAFLVSQEYRRRFGNP